MSAARVVADCSGPSCSMRVGPAVRGRRPLPDPNHADDSRCHTTYGLICGMRRDQGGMKWDGVSRNRADYYRDFSDSERALNLSGSPFNRSGDLGGQVSGDAVLAAQIRVPENRLFGPAASRRLKPCASKSCLPEIVKTFRARKPG